LYAKSILTKYTYKHSSLSSFLFCANVNLVSFKIDLILLVQNVISFEHISDGNSWLKLVNNPDPEINKNIVLAQNYQYNKE